MHKNPHNRYTSDLYRHFPAESLSTFEATPWRILRDHQILHIHWPEHLVVGSRRSSSYIRALAFLALVTWSRFRGATQVWTAHNLEPHEPLPTRLSAAVRKWYVTQADGYIFLSPSSADEFLDNSAGKRKVAYVVIPHGLEVPMQRSSGEVAPSRDDGILRLIYFGQIREYKGVDLLVEAFAGSPGASTRLAVWGKPDPAALGDRLVSLARCDPRISFRFEFVSDQILDSELGVSDVAILPYRQVTNSGSVFHALSRGLPVAVSGNSSYFRDLADKLGNSWIFVFDHLDPTTIVDIEDWFLAHNRPEYPDLAPFSWEQVAHQTAEFMQGLRR